MKKKKLTKILFKKQNLKKKEYYNLWLYLDSIFALSNIDQNSFGTHNRFVSTKCIKICYVRLVKSLIKLRKNKL